MRRTLNEKSTVADYVRFYCALGWSIIPQVPGTKRPAIKWKDRQDAIGTDLKWAETFWTKHADHGILLVLGPASGVVAIDVDSRAAYDCLKTRLGEIPATVTTKSGAHDPFRCHLLFRMPANLATTAKITPWHDQLEFRGKGGLVVLPPSLHPSGKCYRFIDENHANRNDLAELPAPVANEWRKKTQRTPQNRGALSINPQLTGTTTQAAGGNLVLLPGIANATRKFLSGDYAYKNEWNNRLYKSACDLAAAHVDEDRATEQLLRGAQPETEEDRRQAIATIRSAYSQPRQPSFSKLGRYRF